MKETCFERALFFSWYCETADCKYCYMSTQKINRTARRRPESLIAELILCKKFGWNIGFVSGGHNAYSNVEFVDLLKLINKVVGKVWINVGALSSDELATFKHYVKGVVAAVESVNEKVHDYVCPSKPTGPMLEMMNEAKKLGLNRGMTIILGLGETINDFPALETMISDYGITKIHFYSLNPQKGTVFENKRPPLVSYQAEWIKRTRKAFPDIDIQAGIWVNRVKNVSVLLKAGANSISKFPSIRMFGSKEAEEIEKQSALAGRKFKGTLTVFKEFDVRKEIAKYGFEKEFADKVEKKLNRYIKTIRK